MIITADEYAVPEKRALHIHEVAAVRLAWVKGAKMQIIMQHVNPVWPKN
jgi:hypothetical protein